MFFLKKVLLGIGFIALISMGGMGTQSNSLVMQGIGFFGLIAGLIILYIFGRMIWRGLGCLPSFIIVSSIVLFILYSLGIFNNGLGGVGNNVIKFLGYKGEKNTSVSAPKLSKNENVINPDFNEDFSLPEDAPTQKPQEQESLNVSADLFSEDNVMPAQQQPQQKTQQQPKKGLISGIIDAIGGSTADSNQQESFNIENYPLVYGSVEVISADTLEMYGKYVQIYGIDAPEIDQTCADKYGRAYYCGREAASWLKSWIQNAELECRIVKQDTKGNMVGICAYGPYDLGAALVNAGWAVANPNHTDIYMAYEQQAQVNQNGLWQGDFYKPWDWRKLQKRKPKIKVVRPKKRKKGIFG